MKIDWHNLRLLDENGAVVADLSAGVRDWRKENGRDPVVDKRLLDFASAEDMRATLRLIANNPHQQIDHDCQSYCAACIAEEALDRRAKFVLSPRRKKEVERGR